MSIFGNVLMLIGSIVAVLAAIGLLKFETPYARFHSAGKASPVAFLITAIGAAFSLGVAAGALLFIAASAMVVTLPLGVHLLFRAVHATGVRPDLDELYDVQSGMRSARVNPDK